MATWAVTKKEFRLLLRDRLSAVILLLMPLLFVLVLKLLLDEDRLRVTVVDLDEGDYYQLKPDDLTRAGAGTAGLLAPAGGASSWQTAGALFAEQERAFHQFPAGRWADVVLRDLRETAGIRVEMISSREEARRLTTEGRRAAVVVLGPDFSRRMSECSFLRDGINPFYRDGVRLEEVSVEVFRDDTQMAAAAIIDQVTQVAMLRVILPYMIGGAFGKLSQPAFMSMLAERVPGGKFLPPQMKQQLGTGVQGALKDLFSKYDLTAQTWADLTKSSPPEERPGGLSAAWSARYQILVPSSLVMFAFALVLPVGWLFVAERRQGTLKRLQAAPVGRAEVLLGKFLPYFVVSLVQGLFLLVAGKLIFQMSWGPAAWPLWQQALTLLPVVAATSLAAVGLAMLLAAITREEMQVALVGSLLVLLLGLLSGCLIPRELMPEGMIEVSRATPHAWALDAYRQLLTRDDQSAALAPNLAIVTRSCLVLTGFGAGFLGLAWGLLRLR